MAALLRMVIKKVLMGQIALGLCAGLLLVGCTDDYGVDQHGRKVTAEQLEGQWLVINYWAEWCGPCRTEIPELNALAEQLKAKHTQVLGVNFDALQGDALSKAADTMGIRFAVLAQDPGERFKLPRSEALPVTYLVDPKGQVRERLLGEQTAAGLSKRLSELQAKE
ncbi:TlpA disulfide reductase family protein [Pseudomonas sp. GV071]|uniref:TlpA disulfide reductase family protein n=1 Tax=Pseudomonas sp. GV071 TaxID=2135754 RepID=UPI000D3690DD|nr:TlpA disulfide reductase family protein [Pseudomonas sp. GV071]PTQ72279.1 thiol-disulfide isomerase/thioredoxin [Pseudomonas sp. GV071]